MRAAREQFPDSEGLGEVVVRSRIERTDLVLLLSSGRDDDDRRLCPFAKALGDFEPVLVRQTQVEQDEIGVPRGSLNHPVPSCFRFDEAVAVVWQRRTQEAPHLRLVLDHENQRPRVGHGGGLRELGVADGGRSLGASPCSGRLNRNDAPPPARFVTQILPP
jgi:hypothetical protein